MNECMEQLVKENNKTEIIMETNEKKMKKKQKMVKENQPNK